MKLDVYDPAMCCSTGVCGPSVDPSLATFAADLDWLGAQGVQVRRINLGQEPGEFATNDTVRALLEKDGEDALPAIFVEGEFRASGRFPLRDELADWAGVSEPVVSDQLIAEISAIGAAIGSNCEPCFKFHYGEARKLGLTNADLTVAVKTAQAVKDVPAAKVLETAARLLHVEPVALGAAAHAKQAMTQDAQGDTGASCCGDEAAAELNTDTLEESAAPSSGCCS